MSCPTRVTVCHRWQTVLLVGKQIRRNTEDVSQLLEQAEILPKMREAWINWTDLFSRIRDWFSKRRGYMLGFALLGI